MVSPDPTLSRVIGPAEARALFAGLAHRPREIVGAAYLDPEWRLLALRHVAGERDHAVAPIRTIVRDVLAIEARRVLIAHNHPSGDAEPSAGDLSVTRTLAQVLRALGVELVDHLIVTPRATTSLRDRGLL